MRGQTVCRFHGGSTGHARAAGRRRQVEQEAAEAVRQFVTTPVENSLVALSEVAGEIIAVKDYLRGEVERLAAIRTTTAEGTEQLRAEFAAYQAALRDTVHALAVITRLNLDDRLVKIEEAKAALVLQAIDAALTKAGVSGSPAIEARQEAAKQLRAVG